MLARCEERFGKPEQTIIAIGDVEQHRHRKFFEPVKWKGFRTLFRKAGNEVYLVDKCRTPVAVVTRAPPLDIASILDRIVETPGLLSCDMDS